MYFGSAGTKNHNGKQWKYEEAFKDMADKEVAAWGNRGIKRRREFLIPPEGPQNAPIACHLHCPSFSVKDPSLAKTGDKTNLSICQVMDIGFTPKECLIYDHLLRREAVDGLRYYPKDILAIHESYTDQLRQHMGAIVDIVWGRCVRQRMLNTLRLEPLRLWGHYHEVTIWLEWERFNLTGPEEVWRLARFVVFVLHPEAMIYMGQTRKRIQDLHLTVAARLGNLSIDEHFYEESHKPGTYGKLLRVEWARQKMLNLESIAEVKSSTSIPTEGCLDQRLLLNASSANGITTLEFQGMDVTEAESSAVDTGTSDEVDEEVRMFAYILMDNDRSF